jgi:exosortase D (VPLPA-CTERM-specific)
MVVGSLDKVAPGRGNQAPWLAALPVWGLVAANLALLLYVFRDSVAGTVDTWLTSDEYNFGPIVPAVTALMIWRDLRRTNRPFTGGWIGLGLAFIGLLLGVIEFLTHTRFPGQLGLFIAVIGAIAAWQGGPRSRVIWPALVFLMFGLPMAAGIQTALTAWLQLVSSQGAVAVLRAASITVLREGNIIDLGAIKLEVAEACAGLRYLFPLASFAFLAAYMFIAPRWARLLVFLSSVPITIGMNIFRIALTGVLVDAFGAAAAEGFFHAFEGWAVYCLCLVILFAEMKVFCLFTPGGRSLLQRLDFDIPKAPVSPAMSSLRKALPSIGVAALCVITIVVELTLGTRSDAAMARVPFALFPREVAGWKGVEAPVDEQSLRTLKATDHLSLNFVDAAGGAYVNTWIAYYDAQYSGVAAHSPQVCIPGGGWEIESIQPREITVDSGSASRRLPVNRLVIRQGNERSLVYYWFMEGGEAVADETWAKLRLLKNAILYNRRDGALIRFVTPIQGPDDAPADARLETFIRQFTPLLPQYLP